jgi:hypothetical protein
MPDHTLQYAFYVGPIVFVDASGDISVQWSIVWYKYTVQHPNIIYWTSFVFNQFF